MHGIRKRIETEKKDKTTSKVGDTRKEPLKIRAYRLLIWFLFAVTVLQPSWFIGMQINLFWSKQFSVKLSF